MHTRSEPVEAARAEQDTPASRELPRRGGLTRPAQAQQGPAADRAAAAAAFERLKARLHQLVTNKG